MRKSGLCLVVLFVACFFFTASLFAGQSVPPVAFSADYVDMNDGDMEVQGKYYAGPEGIRMESVDDDEPHLMIVNFKKSVTWIVQEEERAYFEMPINPEDSGAFTSPCAELSVKQTMIGRETLNGRSVEKWHCEKWDGRVEKVWFDERLKMNIRTEDQDGGVFELRNIKEGRLSGDLFQPPAGYTKLSMPGLPPQD